jgi:hypothetical protein
MCVENGQYYKADKESLKAFLIKKDDWIMETILLGEEI